MDWIGLGLFVYSWVVAAFLVFFLFLIGRLYEVKFERRSYYQLLLIPLALFLIASVAYAVVQKPSAAGERLDFVGVVIPDLLFLLAGLLLIALCYSLLRLMISRKR